MPSGASIGFRIHTGWAVLVAVGCNDREWRMARRCRIELMPPGRNRFIYHEASELPLSDAEVLIRTARENAFDATCAGLQEALEGLSIHRACIPAGSTPAPGQLADVLGSHPRIHTAEGVFYSDAVVAACRKLKIPAVIEIPSREIWTRASAILGTTETALRAEIDAVRRVHGPPWTADHKIATAAALIG